MATLQLLDSDATTVLFDFTAPTGTGNPSSLRTMLAAAVDLGIVEGSVDISEMWPDGSRLITSRRPPVNMTIPFMADAAGYQELAEGLGQLARWLGSPPGPLKWVEDGITWYIDLLAGLSYPALLRGQQSAGIVASRASSIGPVSVTLLRQPWMRRAEVTTSAVTVPNDPATSTKVRVFPINVQGDLRTPARVTATMDSGSAVQEVLIAHRAVGTTDAADYLSDTGYLNLDATGRGWTITLGTDTTSIADTAASGGNMARVTHASNPTVYARRVRATRATKLSSIRGPFDIWGRMKNTAAADHRIKVAWGPGTADPPAFVNAEVIHDTSANGTPSAFGYVEKNLGRSYIPPDVDLGSFTFEVHTRRVSGTGNLNLDFLWLVPAEQQGTVVVPGGSSESLNGDDLATPVTNPSGGTAGVVIGTRLYLDGSQNAGWPPNAGYLLAAGRHRYTFAINNGWTSGSSSCTCRIRNITDSADAASKTLNIAAGQTRNIVVDVDVGSGTNATTDLYQAQVDDPGANGPSVVSITHEHLPALGSTESLRTEPGTRYAVDRLDTSGNLNGYLGTEGEVPAVLDPADNHIMVRAGDVPLALYDENESVLGRTPTVTVSYFPRYLL